MTLLAEISLSDPRVLMLIFAAVVMVMMLLRGRGRPAHPRHRSMPDESKSPAEASPAIPPRRHVAVEASDDMMRYEIEMYDTARELSAQLDTKMSALRALIAEADRAAARLETALGQSSSGATAGLPGATAGLSSSAETATVDRPPAPAGEVVSRPRHREEIYTLADYGYPAAEIARRVGSPIGEVELILSLRGKK